MSGPHWKQRPEGGGRFAIWLIRSIASRGGRALARACLYPITLYFLVMRGPERRASRAYLERVLPTAPRRGPAVARSGPRVLPSALGPVRARQRACRTSQPIETDKG